MRCESCSRHLGKNEIVHGIRYGIMEDRSNMFLPDRDSAATIVCQQCGEKLLRLIYQQINKPTYL